MKTMTHTKEQRRAWHAGKRKPNESKGQWFRRVMCRDRNFCAAYTPPKMKKGIFYHAR